MILAAIDWLSISINLLLAIFVIVCLLMTLIILMQRPKQEGLGAAFGAGVTDQVFGARTTNVLQRGTVYLGSAFFLISFLLAILIGLKNKTTTLTAEVSETAEVQEVPAPAPETPGSLTEQLPEPPPVTPATPDVEAPELPETTPSPEETPADGAATEPPAAEEEPAAEPAPEENPADSEENPEQP